MITAKEAKKLSKKNLWKKKVDEMDAMERAYIARFEGYRVGIDKLIKERADHGYSYADHLFKTQFSNEDLDKYFKVEEKAAYHLKDYLQSLGFNVIKLEPYKKPETEGHGFIGIHLIVDWA